MASIPQESHSSHQSLDLSEPVTPAGTSGGPSRRAKEDHDKTLARLTDQHFSSSTCRNAFGRSSPSRRAKFNLELTNGRDQNSTPTLSSNGMG